MNATPTELVVCSLEPWDEVWRRNQFLVDGLLRRSSRLRVLFVEPPHSLVREALRGRLPTRPRLRRIRDSGCLHGFQPIKPLPHAVGPLADWVLRNQVRGAAVDVGLREPTLWINDTTYAPLIAATGWPSLYDVTDDWLLASLPRHESARLQRLEEAALRDADEVVVCSPPLARSRGADRSVTLIPNGVDVAHFRRPQPRPDDLPLCPIAVYMGTLHDERVDVDFIVDLARRMPHLHVALVGPDVLSKASQAQIDTLPNVERMGPRPYGDVPAYLQHADVLVVPHRVTPFTESLDPIKAYECLAVGTPTVATNIAGFRDLGGNIITAPRERFATAVTEALGLAPAPAPPPVDDISWESRVRDFEAALRRATRRARQVAADR